MGDLIVGFAIAYAFIGLLTALIISDINTPGKTAVGIYILWPLFALKLILRVVRQAGRVPMFFVGAFRGAIEELKRI